MIAKISSGKNFYGAANYNQQKVDKGSATILYSQNLRKTSPSQIQKTFDLANRTRIKKPVFHVSLSFSAADKVKLSNENMLKVTQDYLEKMGYSKQPYIVYRHNDTAHPHVHILTSRVDVATQKKLPHSFEHRKSKRITDELEVKYELTISDKQQLAKREMLGDLQKAMQNGKPESLKKLNKELSNIGSDIRIKQKGKGLVYYRVGTEDEKQTTKSVKSSLFKNEGLDKKGLEKEFTKNRSDRLYVKGNVEKVLAKSPNLPAGRHGVNAITFARQLQEKGIETEFRYGKDKVIGVNYKYQDHTYKGSTLDRSLSFNKTKEQLNFPDIESLKLRKNLLDNVQAGKPIDMTYDGKKVVFTSANPELNRQLKELPQKDAIDLTRKFNGYQSQYEKGGINEQKLIKGMAEDNLDEYLQRRFKNRQKQNERRIRR
ncbi:MAG: relaxase/mobilization nuclease domain-containing protein [Bacteroidota bacterium]